MNLKALYENLLSNQTPETINEASTQQVNVSPGQRILEGLSNEKAITSRRRAVKESSKITESGSTSNLDELKKVVKEIYGLKEEFEVYGDSLELLNAEAMKEVVDHVSKDDEDRIIVQSDKNLYVIDYYIYQGRTSFIINEYQDAWARDGVDPFEISFPVGRLAKNKALQRAWQSVRIGEEPDLEGINESISARDLPKKSNFPSEILNKRKHGLKDQPSKGKIDNYFSDEIKESISGRREINESSEEMKIYHTETQADYDALMKELSAEGITWPNGQRLTKDSTPIWKNSETQTCVRVTGTIAFRALKSYYEKEYPNIPIIKYSARIGEEPDLEGINEATSNKRIRPRIQEGSVKFPDLSKLQKSKKPRLLKEAAGDEEDLETPQDEFEQDLSSENSTDSVEEETTGFSLDDAVLIDGDLVLTISKDSGHVVSITLTDVDLDEEILVYNKSEGTEDEEDSINESSKMRIENISRK